jgi:mannose-6-phosphate isomerase
VQVHPDDTYAALHERSKLGKTEYWYILAAEPGASIIHGFKSPTTRAQVHEAIRHETLEQLLHEETVQVGDVIFVPAGTVHAIGRGVMLYELQEYSDITYRMYDYGRRTAAGTQRQLHIEQSLAVSHYGVSPLVKVMPVQLAGGPGCDERCLVACKYFVTREMTFSQKNRMLVEGRAEKSCIVLSSLEAEVQVHFGPLFTGSERLSRGETMVLPAALGSYRIEGEGRLLLSYVPTSDDKAWRLWEEKNGVTF